MSGSGYNKDLIVLVADKPMEFALRGLLDRPPSVGIRPVRYDVFAHPERDPGCRLRSPEFLGAFQRRYEHAMVLFDYEGCGSTASADEVRVDVETRLTDSGWSDRAGAIVIVPELEAWVWSDSPHVDKALGWGGRQPTLREWLLSQRFIDDMRAKPARPKEAMLAALRGSRKALSAALFLELAKTVGFGRCVDPTFQRLIQVLRAWFPASTP